MPADRIKIIGLSTQEGPLDDEVVLFRAGKILYKAIPVRTSYQLIDGSRYHKNLYYHLEFTIMLGYLDQQILQAEASTTIKQNFALLSAPLTVSATERPLRMLLEFLQFANTQTYFYPRIQNNAGTIDVDTRYAVHPANKDYKLFEANENGRYNLFLPITLVTRAPITNLPTWINR